MPPIVFVPSKTLQAISSWSVLFETHLFLQAPMGQLAKFLELITFLISKLHVFHNPLNNNKNKRPHQKNRVRSPTAGAHDLEPHHQRRCRSSRCGHLRGSSVFWAIEHRNSQQVWPHSQDKPSRNPIMHEEDAHKFPPPAEEPLAINVFPEKTRSSSGVQPLRCHLDSSCWFYIRENWQH